MNSASSDGDRMLKDEEASRAVCVREVHAKYQSNAETVCVDRVSDNRKERSEWGTPKMKMKTERKQKQNKKSQRREPKK